jgi:hypothetical protein
VCPTYLVFDIDDTCAHVVKTLCAALAQNEEDRREDDCLDKWNAVRRDGELHILRNFYDIVVSQIFPLQISQLSFYKVLMVPLFAILACIWNLKCIYMV